MPASRHFSPLLLLPLLASLSPIPSLDAANFTDHIVSPYPSLMLFYRESCASCELALQSLAVLNLTHIFRVDGPRNPGIIRHFRALAFYPTLALFPMYSADIETLYSPETADGWNRTALLLAWVTQNVLNGSDAGEGLRLCKGNTTCENEGELQREILRISLQSDEALEAISGLTEVAMQAETKETTEAVSSNRVWTGIAVIFVLGLAIGALLFMCFRKLSTPERIRYTVV